VSMREPYPVVNDVPIPKKGADMFKLQGKGAYQNYNTHYIPVTSTDPSNADNMIYHPCHATEQPAWDEYVVFNNTQTLPRFIVELGVDLPMAVSGSVLTVEAFNDTLLALLDNKNIQADEEMSKILSDKSNELFNLNLKDSLPPEHLPFYNRVVKLLDPSGNVRSAIKKQLVVVQPATSAANSPKPTVVSSTASLTTSASQKKDVESGKKEISAQPTTSLSSMDSLDEPPPSPPPEDNVESIENKSCKVVTKSISSSAAKITKSPTAATVVSSSGEILNPKTGDIVAVPGSIDPKSLEKTDTDGNTPLLNAAKAGNIALCKTLLTAGASPNATGKNGKNALHYAVQNENLELVLVFAAHKQMLNAQDTSGNTPLIIAARCRHAKACEALLAAGANPSMVDLQGYNALHYAAMNGTHEVIPIFAAYKQLINAKDAEGNTPLYHAFRWDHLKACKALFLVGADPSITNMWGRNIFTSMANDRNLEKITLLLADCKQLLNAKDANGDTPLMVASDGDPQVWKALLNAGADPNAVDDLGNNGLHRVSLRTLGGHSREGILLFAAYKQLLNAKNKAGETPLMVAAKEGKYLVCIVLLAAGADPNIINEKGYNALHFAARSERHEGIDAFYAHKQLFNAKDVKGDTPLMVAASYGNLKACEALLDAGADRSIAKGGIFGSNIGGTTALDLARQSTSSSKDEIIKLLSSYKK